MQDKKNHRFYAACPWGLEAVLEEELAACGAKRSRKTPSGVMFEGTIDQYFQHLLYDVGLDWYS